MTIPMTSLPAPSVPALPPPPGPAEGEESASGISMMQITCILRAFWKHSVVIMVVAVVLAALAIRSMPKEYVATATLLVDHDDKDPLAARDGPDVMELTYIPTQIELMTSSVVLDPVVQRLDLTHDKQFARGFVGTAAGLRDAVVHNLQDALTVQQGKGSQLLYIAVTDPRPVRAAQIANAVADEYLKQELRHVTQPAGERATRYSQDVLQLKAKEVAAQQAVTDFRKEHDLTDVEGGADLEDAALTELEGKLLDAQNARRELEAHQVNPELGSTQPVAMDSGAVQALRGQLTAEQQQMAQMLATLGPRHPKVVALQSEMTATRHLLEAEVQSLATSKQASLQRARELEAKYQAAVDAQRAKVVQHRALLDQAKKLLVELASAEDTYRRALDNEAAQGFAASAADANVTLVSYADPPVKSEKPNKMKLFLMASMGALGAGLGLPFLYELLLNRRLRCRDDFERNFGVPVLAQFGPIGSRA